MSSELELQAVELKESKVLLFQLEAELSAEAKVAGQARHVAHLWGCSTAHVNTMGDIWAIFPKDLMLPDIPLSLYRAALDTDCPVEALRKAIAEGWSARELRDHYDILKGKHLSDCVFAGDAVVETWDVATQAVTLVGLPLSGEAPDVVRASLREVLDNGKN